MVGTCWDLDGLIRLHVERLTVRLRVTYHSIVDWKVSWNRTSRSTTPNTATWLTMVQAKNITMMLSPLQIVTSCIKLLGCSRNCCPSLLLSDKWPYTFTCEPSEQGFVFTISSMIVALRFLKNLKHVSGLFSQHPKAVCESGMNLWRLTLKRHAPAKDERDLAKGGWLARDCPVPRQPSEFKARRFYPGNGGNDNGGRSQFAHRLWGLSWGWLARTPCQKIRNALWKLPRSSEKCLGPQMNWSPGHVGHVPSNS